MAADEDKRLLVKYQQWRCGDEISLQQQSKQLAIASEFRRLVIFERTQIVFINWFPGCIYIYPMVTWHDNDMISWRVTIRDMLRHTVSRIRAIIRAGRRNVTNNTPDCWHRVPRCIVSIIRNKWSLSRSLWRLHDLVWCYRTSSGCGNGLLKTASSPLLQSS